MNEYSGEAFLDKLYPSLHLSKQVLHTQDKSKTNAENIRTYLERLERVHSKAINKNKLNKILMLYYDKYVISENNIQEESLNGENSVETIIANQKNSIKEWITYLSSEGAKYPLWAKYWAFQGMLKIGNYNELYDPSDARTGKAFTSRTKHTIAPFIKCNPELIAKAIELIVKYNNGKKLDDEEVEKLVSTGSFSKIYGILFYRNKQQNKIKRLNITEGIWVKYNQGSREDAIKLSNSLQGYDTGWCTACDETAISQVCGDEEYNEGGDFYVYYTLDENGEYKVPRIAIRMDGKNNIGEIRGIDEDQNLEELMLPILETKLNEMDNIRDEDKKENLQIIDDLKFLTEIYRKYKLGKELTCEELKKFSSIEEFGFGWDNEKRAYELEKLPIYKLANTEAKYNKEVILLLVKNNFETFKYVPTDIDNYNEFIYEVIKVNGFALKYVKEELKTSKLCMLAVEQKTNSLEFVPETVDNYEEIARKAVTKNRKAIKFVHGNNLIEVLLHDIRYGIINSVFEPSIVSFIPESYKKECPEDYFYSVLYFISEDYDCLNFIDVKDPIYIKLVIELVSRGKNNILGYIDDECFTDEFLKRVIYINNYNFTFIPKKFLNDEIIKYYLDKDGSLFHVQDNMINYEIALYAVKKRGYNIRYVPEEIVDKEIAKAALNNGCSLDDIPQKIIDKELLDISFNNKKYSLKNVPGEIIDYDTATTSVSDDGLNLEFVPEELKDKKLIDIAFSNNVKSIQFIPEKFITLEMSQKAVDENVALIQFIPKEHIDNELAMRAVKEDGMLLMYIPKDIMTVEIVYEAFIEHPAKFENLNEFDVNYISQEAKAYSSYVKNKMERLREYVDEDIYAEAFELADAKVSSYWSSAYTSQEEYYASIYM